LLHAPPTTQISPLSLHDALPIYIEGHRSGRVGHGQVQPADQQEGEIELARAGEEPADVRDEDVVGSGGDVGDGEVAVRGALAGEDRKSTRLNSSHVKISYAVFCL